MPVACDYRMASIGSKGWHVGLVGLLVVIWPHVLMQCWMQCLLVVYSGACLASAWHRIFMGKQSSFGYWSFYVHLCYLA